MSLVLSRARARASVFSRAWLRTGLSLALVSGALACSAANQDGATADDVPTGDPVETSEAIVHGAVDHGRHPAVVALVIEDASGTALCTGALIAPDVVLTARHCVSVLASDAVDCPSSGPQVTGDRDPSTISVVVDDSIKSAAPAATGVEIVTPRGDSLCDADIALLRLDHPIDGIEPLSIATDDAGAPLDGKKVVTVGYGLSKNSGGSAGIRRFRSHVAVHTSSNAEFVVGESTCQGDSGGPAIDEDDGSILGVVSRGGAKCTGKSANNIYTRVDAFLPLIESVLGPTTPPPPDDGDAGTTSGGGKHHGKKKKKPPATDIGTPCTSGSTCSAGICVENKEVGGRYCSHECGKGKGRCEKGWKCTHKKKGDAGVCTKKK